MQLLSSQPHPTSFLVPPLCFYVRSRYRVKHLS
jgi:hypothetical protein